MNNRVEKTMIFHYHNYNYFYIFGNIYGDFNQFVIYYFGQVVNNNKNQVAVITFLVSR